MAVVDPQDLVPQLQKILEEAALGEFFRRLSLNPKKRHRFRVAIAACPNACTQVHIADFGLIGQMVPSLAGDCVACGVCEEVCEEEAVTIDGRWPLFHLERCLNCGLCIRACPKQVLTSEAQGYRVLVGGKLGRHPQLAREVVSLAQQDRVLFLLRETLAFYKAHCRAGERLGTIIQRVGWETFLSSLHPYEPQNP